MKRATYINQHGDEIIFEEISNKRVQISGFEHFKFSSEYIHPEGGPYIQIGSDIGRYFDDKKVRQVESFEFTDNKIILIVK